MKYSGDLLTVINIYQGDAASQPLAPVVATKCSLNPKNQPTEVLPLWAIPAKTRWLEIRRLWQRAICQCT